LNGMSTPPIKKILAPIVPYVTIGVGLLVFHSVWAAILSYHAAMIAIMVASPGNPMKRPFQGRGFLLPLAAGLAGASAGILLFLFWPLPGLTENISSYVRSIGLNEGTWPAFLIYFILVNPLIEEFYWRGHLAAVSRGIELNDLMFSGYHLIVMAGLVEMIWLVIVFAFLTVGAWFWRQINKANGGMLASIISHTAADATIMLVIYFISGR
jgi:hypothetical protein